MVLGLAELLVLLALGGGMPSATSVLYAHPVLLLGVNTVARAAPAGALWGLGRIGPSRVLSGPVGILAQPPVTVPARPAP